MKIIAIFTCFIIALWGLGAQDIEVYDSYSDFKANLILDETKVYAVNYWATWCAPCVRELPYFEKLKSEYEGKGVEVVLVSIDFKNQFEKRLVPFVKEKKLMSRLIHMTDPKPNNWIAEVDASWSGAIPVTVLISKSKRQFIDHEFHTYDDLKLELEKFIE